MLSRHLLIAYGALMLIISCCFLAATVQGEHSSSLDDRRNADLSIVENLRPIKDGDHIMYWRPQKVGSSTLLSILMSYAYRYNFLPRRKSYSNAGCGRLADCALRQDEGNLTTSQTAYLKKLVNSRGHSGRPPARFREQQRQEEYARSIPFKIILTHEMCNINDKIVERNLACVFDAAWSKKPSSSSFTPLVREIFQVRDPISRAISAYYFWGELYKLIKARKKKSFGASAKHTNLPDSSSMFVNGKRADRTEEHEEAESERFADRLAKKKRKRSKEKKEDDSTRRLFEVEEEGDNQEEEDDINGEHRQLAAMLGATTDTSPVKGGLFTYHGNEKTSPSLVYAMDYIRDLPYMAGMPGPSYTWSAFANNAQATAQRLSYTYHTTNTNNNHVKVAPHYPALASSSEIALFSTSSPTSLPVMSIVLERLEESLVVLRHHLGWSLADVIYVKQRKALSSHPKAKDWPKEAISLLHKKMENNGEYTVYNASVLALDRRIQTLQEVYHVNVSDEVRQFRILRARVSELCLQDEHLLHYKQMMDATKLPPHPSDNKLRDVEAKYAENGHIYSFNREILCSFDVCGGCEAHAMMLGWQKGLSANLETAPALKDLPKTLRDNNVNFAHCPTW